MLHPVEEECAHIVCCKCRNRADLIDAIRAIRVEHTATGGIVSRGVLFARHNEVTHLVDCEGLDVVNVWGRDRSGLLEIGVSAAGLFAPGVDLAAIFGSKGIRDGQVRHPGDREGCPSVQIGRAHV